MHILHPGALLPGDSSVALLDVAVAFDTHIQAIGSLRELQERYPDAPVSAHPHCVLLPGWINAHVHLEFSAHIAGLRYGNFLEWLESVMQQRSVLSAACGTACMRQTLETMLRTGTTAIGAISSFGADLEALQESPLRCVYFLEVIGAHAARADSVVSGLRFRLDSLLAHPAPRLHPALSIHSPYAVHPDLAREVVTLAKEHGLPLCAHYLESTEERSWLTRGEGAFGSFFERYLGILDAAPNHTPESFLEHFAEIPALFVHGNTASSGELAALALKGHHLISCPVSNRLLEGTTLRWSEARAAGLHPIIATDGLSSNISLNLYDELRTALFMHQEVPLHLLAHELIQSVTAIPARALGLNSGILAPGKDADFQLVAIPEGCPAEALPLQILLHTHAPEAVYIAGECVAQKEHG